MKKIAFVALVLVVSMFAWASPPPPAFSEVAVDTANGFGSTGKYARTFQSVDVNSGSDITYSSSVVNGDSFTINTSGIYSVSLTDISVVGDSIVISLNTAGTLMINDATPANRLCGTALQANIMASCSVTLELSVGDVLRATRSTGGNCSCTDLTSLGRFVVTKVK